MPTIPQHLTTVPFFIKAGGGELQVSKSGNLVLCKEADGVFDLYVDEQVYLQDFMLGLDYRPLDGQVFHSVRLVNNSARDVRGVLAIGYGNIGDHRTNIIKERGSLSTVTLSPNKIRATNWDNLEAGKWITVPADNTRDSLCIVTGSPLLWRINGVTAPAPWTGIERPSSFDWLELSDSFDFCIESDARCVLYERRRVAAVPTETPDDEPEAPKSSAIRKYFHLDGTPNVANSGTLVIPAQDTDLFLMIFAQQDVFVGPNNNDTRMSIRTQLLANGVVIAESDLNGLTAKYGSNFKNTTGVTHGMRLPANTALTLKIKTYAYDNGGGWDASNQSINVFALDEQPESLT